MNNSDDTYDSERDAPSTGLGKDPADLALGYLTCPQDAANNFLGAVLITDSRSRPLHFAYVTPVRPTAMQRLLYGNTLKEHVRIDVITKRLFGDGVPTVPDVLFVDDEELLPSRRVVNVPTAFLTRKSSEEEDASSFTTVRYSTGSNALDQERVGQVIAALEDSMDLTDPFKRLRDALKEAMKGD